MKKSVNKSVKIFYTEQEHQELLGKVKKAKVFIKRNGLSLPNITRYVKERSLK